MIRLSSRHVSLVDMSVLARWKIRPRLMGVPGVANVAIYGQRDRQLQVLVDPRRLGAERVSLTRVIETAGNALWVSPLTFVEASTPGTGGFVESPNQRLNVQHISPISRPAQLAAVPVDSPGKSGTLRLGDVAKVIVDHQPLIGDAVAGGAPSLYLVIEKSPGANTLQVTRDVESALAEMAPGLRGISIDTHVYRPATYLQTALKNVGLAGLIGLALLFVVLVALLASWRAALIAVGVTAVSLSAAAYVLYLRGATFTTMTLLALAAVLALCIDDAVTDIDAARRRPPCSDVPPDPPAQTAPPSMTRLAGRRSGPSAHAGRGIHGRARAADLRDAGDRRRDAPLPRAGITRDVIHPAAGAHLRARRAGVDARRVRADAHARRAAPARQRRARRLCRTRRPGGNRPMVRRCRETGQRSGAGELRGQAGSGVVGGGRACHRGRRRRRRRRGAAGERAVSTTCPPGPQSAAAARDRAGNLAGGNEPRLCCRRRRSAFDSGRDRRRRPRRARDRIRPARRRQLRRGVDHPGRRSRLRPQHLSRPVDDARIRRRQGHLADLPVGPGGAGSRDSA